MRRARPGSRATFASLRSPWRPSPGSRSSAATSGAGSASSRVDEVARSRRRASVEQRPSPRGSGRRPGCRRRHSGRPMSGRAGSAARPADTTVAPRRRRRSSAPSRTRVHGTAWSRASRADDPGKRRAVDRRVVTRPLPGDQLVGEVRHQDGHAVAVGGRAEVRHHRAGHPREGALGQRGEPALAELGRRGSLARSSRSPAMSASGRICGHRCRRWHVNVAPDQPSVGNSCSGSSSRPNSSGGPATSGPASCRSSGDRGQQGAGTSSAPSGPPSRYTTCESGQFRVRTTTSGSFALAFSSTWISPAGM